jgi:hypothetical protein
MVTWDVQGGGYAMMARQREVIGWRGQGRDCPGGGIDNGQFIVMLLMCAASIELWRIMRERGLAH